jgi:hypothetical protein
MILEEDIKPASTLTISQSLMLLLAGVLPYFLPVSLTAFWALLIILSFAGLVKDRTEWIWYCIGASPGMEVWARMSRAPYIPDEIGKYFLAYAILLLFIHHVFRRSEKPLYHTGLIIILLLLPSLIAGIAHFDMQQWIFNVLGPLEMAALLFLAARERWPIEQFCRVLQMALLPIVAMVIFITIKAPGIDDLQFSLSSNRAASGGFGSNQISTILGVGVVLTMLLQLMHRPLFAIKWVNYLLLFYLLFRDLLTFSRGGVIVAVISIMVALYPYIFESLRSFIRYSALFIFLILAGYLVFNKVNDMTGNMLLLRYQGETSGTLTGSREKSWDSYLSGRGTILESDIAIFLDNPVLGSGPGGGRRLREKYGVDAAAAHTEFSRLLSEHGIGGLVIIFVLIAFPFIWIRKQNIKVWKGIIASLFVMAVLTTFHAAMRTNVMSVFYALAAIPVLIYTNSEQEDEDTLPG